MAVLEEQSLEIFPRTLRSLLHEVRILFQSEWDDRVLIGMDLFVQPHRLAAKSRIEPSVLDFSQTFAI